MRRHVSRLILFATLTGSAAVLVGAGIALRDPLVERWMLHRLETGDAGEKASAMEWLGRRGTARAVPCLLGELDRMVSPEDDAPGRDPLVALLQLVPAAALFAIADRHPGDFARAVVGTVATLNTRTAWYAARVALVRLAERASPAVPDLVRKLEGSDPSAWDWVPSVLARIGPAARPALPLLVARIESGEPGTVVMARVVGDIATAHDVPLLLALLRSPDPWVRRAVLWTFERMGPRAAKAAPALEACLGDADDEVRLLATQALGSIREEHGSSPHARASRAPR